MSRSRPRPEIAIASVRPRPRRPTRRERRGYRIVPTGEAQSTRPVAGRQPSEHQRKAEPRFAYPNLAAAPSFAQLLGEGCVTIRAEGAVFAGGGGTLRAWLVEARPRGRPATAPHERPGRPSFPQASRRARRGWSRSRLRPEVPSQRSSNGNSSATFFHRVAWAIQCPGHGRHRSPRHRTMLAANRGTTCRGLGVGAFRAPTHVLY